MVDFSCMHFMMCCARDAPAVCCVFIVAPMFENLLDRKCIVRGIVGCENFANALHFWFISVTYCHGVHYRVAKVNFTMVINSEHVEDQNNRTIRTGSPTAFQ